MTLEAEDARSVDMLCVRTFCQYASFAAGLAEELLSSPITPLNADAATMRQSAPPVAGGMVGSGDLPSVQRAELLVHDVHGLANLRGAMLGGDEKAEPRRLQRHGRIDDGQHVETSIEQPLTELGRMQQITNDDRHDRMALAGCRVQASRFGVCQEQLAIPLQARNALGLGLDHA